MVSFKPARLFRPASLLKIPELVRSRIKIDFHINFPHQ